MSSNNVKQLSKIPNESGKKISPQKTIKFDGSSGATDYSLEEQISSSKKVIGSTGKLKISKKGIISKNSMSEIYETDNKSVLCEKCGSIKESVIKTLTNLKCFIDGTNEKINRVYHKINKNPKLLQDMFGTQDFFQFYSDIDKIKCGSEISTLLRVVMKSTKLLSDKYEYIINKQSYYENIVSLFKNLKHSNKEEDLSRFSRELSFLENQNKENCDVPELFRKFNCSREAAEKILRDLRSTLNENNIRTEDKTTYFSAYSRVLNEMEINLEPHDQYKENFFKNEVFRLQKENMSLRVYPYLKRWS